MMMFGGPWLNGAYSEDFTYTTPDGVLRSKAEQLAFVEAGRLGLISGSSDDLRVRLYGDFAVITGRFNGVLRGASGKVCPAVLSLAGAPLGEALRGKALASHVQIEAADGYRVATSVAHDGFGRW